MIKTVVLRSVGILLVLAGAALLVPSQGATDRRGKQDTALHAPTACLRSDARPDGCRRAARLP